MPELTQNNQPASRKPDFSGPRAGAYRGTRQDGSEYLALYLPGLEPVYLNKVPDAERRSEKSPLYKGRDGAVFLNHSKEGKPYLAAKIEGMPKSIPFFAPDDDQA